MHIFEVNHWPTFGQAGNKKVSCLCRSSATIQKPSERLSGRGGTDGPRDLPVHWQPAHQVLLDQKQQAGVVFVRLASESFIGRRLKIHQRGGSTSQLGRRCFPSPVCWIAMCPQKNSLPHTQSKNVQNWNVVNFTLSVLKHMTASTRNSPSCSLFMER